MVVPYDIGDPARSFVRIPGSGSDPSLKSVCCDLSRGAAVAASSPIPQNIPHLQLTSGTAASAVKNEFSNSGKIQKPIGIKTPPHQPPSVGQQLHAQVKLTVSVATMINNSQGTQSDQLATRKLPLLDENNNIQSDKFSQPQIILPSKIIKINTGRTATQEPPLVPSKIIKIKTGKTASQEPPQPPPKTRVNVTIKKRTIRHPTLNSIKKAVNRMSPPRSFNISGAIQNSQHTRGIPELEKDGKLLNQQNRIQRHQLFQEIFKDKRRLATLLKRLDVIH